MYFLSMEYIALLDKLKNFYIYVIMWAGEKLSGPAPETAETCLG